jgi:hypothetical protein
MTEKILLAESHGMNLERFGFSHMTVPLPAPPVKITSAMA